MNNPNKFTEPRPTPDDINAAAKKREAEQLKADTAEVDDVLVLPSNPSDVLSVGISNVPGSVKKGEYTDFFTVDNEALKNSPEAADEPFTEVVPVEEAVAMSVEETPVVEAPVVEAPVAVEEPKEIIEPVVTPLATVPKPEPPKPFVPVAKVVTEPTPKKAPYKEEDFISYDETRRRLESLENNLNSSSPAIPFDAKPVSEEVNIIHPSHETTKAVAIPVHVVYEKHPVEEVAPEAPETLTAEATAMLAIEAPVVVAEAVAEPESTAQQPDATVEEVIAEVAPTVSTGTLNQSEIDASYDEAKAENATVDLKFSETVRSHTEGEYLVEKDPRLQGLMDIGQELIDLQTSGATGNYYETVVKPNIEKKQIVFDNLLEYYTEKGLDDRALSFIAHKTRAGIEEPGSVSVEGSPYYKGEKVTILDFVETPDGKKAYVIEQPDGSVFAAFTNEIIFEREIEKTEAVAAPEATDTLDATQPIDILTAQAEAEDDPAKTEPADKEKLTLKERIKKFRHNDGKKFRDTHGLAYWNAYFTTNVHMMGERLTPKNLSEQGLESHKLRVRRNYMIGTAVLAVAVVATRGFGVGDMISDALSNVDFDNGSWTIPDIGHADGLTADDLTPQPDVIGHADGGAGFDGAAPDEAPAPSPTPERLELDYGDTDGPGTTVENPDSGFEGVTINVDNPAYDIPNGGGGIKMFESLDMNEARWNEHAQELVNRFPDTFGYEGTDVRIKTPGVLPLDVRQAIEEIRTR